MKIEDAIKQKKFQDTWHKAVVNLLFTSNIWRNTESEIFSPFGINPQQYNVLRIIKGKHPKPISPGEIKEVMLDKGIDLTRLVDKLLKLGLVARKISAENRRKVEINISKKGEALLNEIAPLLYSKTSQIKTRITEEEAETLSNLLDKLRS
jgi:DNA-binding MarR family transcriptional regulator